MAERWTVTPNQGVTGTGPTFTFPENTGTSPIVYTIKYEDADGCTASTKYTVLTGETCQPVQPCTCDNFEWDSETTKHIETSGGDTAITYSNTCTTPTTPSSVRWYESSSSTSPTSKPDWITSTALTSSQFSFHVNASQPSSTISERFVYVTFMVNNQECSQRYRIEQEVAQQGFRHSCKFIMQTATVKINTFAVDCWIRKDPDGPNLFYTIIGDICLGCDSTENTNELDFDAVLNTITGPLSDYTITFSLRNFVGTDGPIYESKCNYQIGGVTLSPRDKWTYKNSETKPTVFSTTLDKFSSMERIWYVVSSVTT